MRAKRRWAASQCHVASRRSRHAVGAASSACRSTTAVPRRCTVARCNAPYRASRSPGPASAHTASRAAVGRDCTNHAAASARVPARTTSSGSDDVNTAQSSSSAAQPASVARTTRHEARSAPARAARLPARGGSRGDCCSNPARAAPALAVSGTAPSARLPQPAPAANSAAVSGSAPTSTVRPHVATWPSSATICSSSSADSVTAEITSASMLA